MRDLDRDHSQGADEYTWDLPSGLGARLEVPVTGAWERMYAGPKRRAMLETAFSSQAAQPGHVIGLCGPALCGKSQVALGLADMRGLRTVYVTDQADQQALAPAPGLCVIIDPVSYYKREDVIATIDLYVREGPVLLVDRDQGVLNACGAKPIVKLRLPSPGMISVYIHEMLDGYPNNMQNDDYQQLGDAMHGLSLPQVNQVTVDAALSRLSADQPVDRRAFDEALHAHGLLRRQAEAQRARARSGTVSNPAAQSRSRARKRL